MASANRLGEWAKFLDEDLPDSHADRRDADFDGSFEDFFETSSR